LEDDVYREVEGTTGSTEGLTADGALLLNGKGVEEALLAECVAAFCGDWLIHYIEADCAH